MSRISHWLWLKKQQQQQKHPRLSAQKKTTANKKAKWASPGAHLTFCFAFVCVRTCFCHALYVCTEMFMKHVSSWIYLWTQNVMWLFFLCVLSHSFCFCFSLAAHCFLFFFPLPLPHFPTLSISLSTLSVPFLLCLFICPLPVVLPVLSTLFLSFWVLSFLSLFPSSTPFPRWPGAQETSGLSPAAGCGRHGEDAWARLEVCVHVPAGVLQGSGDEGPG